MLSCCSISPLLFFEGMKKVLFRGYGDISSLPAPYKDLMALFLMKLL
jgi:hypothetical protein